MSELRDPKRELMCKVYVLEGLNKTDSYLRAHPSAKTKKRTINSTRAYEIFKEPRTAARVAELVEYKEETAKKEFQVDAAYVLRRLVDLDRMDVADIMDGDGALKPVKEWPLLWRQFIIKFDVEELFAGRGDERLNIGLLKKIQWPDKVRILELLGKHINVGAFKETLEHTGPGGGALRMITGTMTAEEAAEAYADTLNK